MKARTTRAVTVPQDITVPTHEEIVARAYDLYLQRGDAEGDAMSDWLRAEQELLDLHARVAPDIADQD